MKEYTALSVKQPWAGLIAAGCKTIETRTWKTDYRGLLIVCSSKAVDIDALQAVKHELPGVPVEAFKTVGMALCTARLVDCRPMTVLDEKAACCRIYPRAVAWVLEDVRPLPLHRRVRGQLGLFKVQL